MGSLFSSSSKLADVPDLTGCVAIVTGANGGIGYQTVKQLASRGAKVYLGARSEAKAAAAIQKMHDEGLGNRPGEVVWLDLDLADPRQAKAAAERVLAREQRLDILSTATEFKATADGLSENMLVNHLSPFLFTNTLLPLLIATAALPDADVRIVNVTSEGHNMAKHPRFDTLEALHERHSSKWTLYGAPPPPLSSRDGGSADLDLDLVGAGHTKLANILHAKELQRRLDAQGARIIVTAIHPGMVMSEGADVLLRTLPLGSLIVKILPLFTTPLARGGDPSVFAAAAPAVRARADEFRGAYLLPVGKIALPSKDARDERLAGALWATSEKQLAALGL
ncbi:hypothetical protein HWV62_23514 [Athelia sp. TMB]|nr:hypothetical protein HWV62_23514 [Athelia sp. TMB]